MTWNKFLRKCILFSVFLTILSDGQSQDADYFIAKALELNPGLKAMQLTYEAALKIEDQVDKFPDPTFSLGIGALPIETRLGPQRFRLGVSQMVPWKGLLNAKRQLAKAQAEIKAGVDKVKEIDVAYSIQMAYSTLVLASNKRDVIDSRLEVLEVLEEIAKNAVQSGKGKLSNVLLIQRTKETLLADQELLIKQQEIPTILINRWSARPLDMAIELDRSQSWLDNFSSEDKIVLDHPEFKILDAKIAASEEAINLSRLSQKPKIGVGLDYSWIGKRDQVELAKNGRDVIMPMGSISIPLDTKRFSAKREEEGLRQKAVKEQAINLRQSFEAERAHAISSIEYAQMIIDKMQNLKEITQETIILMRTEYASEGTRFEELLRLEMELIDYDLEIVHAGYKADLAKAILLKYK